MPRPDHIDPETWRLMVAYGGDPYVPRMRRIEVMDEWCNQEWTLEEFQHLLADAVEEIPPEHRAATTVEFDGGDSESSGHFTVYYNRQETAEEMEENAKRYMEYAQGRKAEEKATYARLKAKFG